MVGERDGAPLSSLSSLFPEDTNEIIESAEAADETTTSETIEKDAPIEEPKIFESEKDDDSTTSVVTDVNTEPLSTVRHPANTTSRPSHRSRSRLLPLLRSILCQTQTPVLTIVRTPRYRLLRRVHHTEIQIQEEFWQGRSHRELCLRRAGTEELLQRHVPVCEAGEGSAEVRAGDVWGGEGRAVFVSGAGWTEGSAV